LLASFKNLQSTRHTKTKVLFPGARGLLTSQRQTEGFNPFIELWSSHQKRFEPRS
jgi:hypothetical protein